MKKILAILLILILAVQSFPGLVRAEAEQVSLEQNMDSTKEVLKKVNEGTEKQVTSIEHSLTLLIAPTVTYRLPASEKIVAAAREVVVPPPDFC